MEVSPANETALAMHPHPLAALLLLAFLWLYRDVIIIIVWTHMVDGILGNSKVLETGLCGH